MKVKVYVNRHSRKVVNEKDLEKEIEEVFEDYKGDQHYFADWLEKNYRVIKVWEMDDEERIKTVKAFEEHCLFAARTATLYDWKEKELDV